MSAPRKRSNSPATLADVGREAGVSAMAASAVLNGARTSTRISRETRARILDAAVKLSYRPNAAARALAQRRMNTLGIAAVINDGGEFDHYFLEAFNGIITNAAVHSQTTTVFALHDWQRDARATTASLAPDRVAFLETLLGAAVCRRRCLALCRWLAHTALGGGNETISLRRHFRPRPRFGTAGRPAATEHASHGHGGGRLHRV